MKIDRFLPALATLAIGASLHAQPIWSPARSYPIWEQPDQPSPGLSRGQTPPRDHGRVHRINPNTETFGLRRMTGRPVRSRNGEDLSTITDFLVDPKTGRVHFAMLPSGGGPRGMTYRIVPIGAFTASNEDALSLRLDRAQWDRVGTMEEAQLKDRVTIDVDHQQRLSRQLGLPLSEIYDGRGPARLVRASTLRGQSIRTGNGQLGRIEDIVVDVTRHESAIVLSTDRSFNGSEQRFVVTFQTLGTNENGRWTSRLNRDDFPAADYDRPVGDDRRGGFRDGNSPAIAVQSAIDHSWARGQVDATTEGPRLILRGLLDNGRDRAEIERLAERTAPGVRIDNQIAVRQR